MKSKFHRILRLNIVYSLSLYQFILNTEPLVERILNLCVDFRSDLILDFLIDIEHCHAIIQDAQELIDNTWNEVHRQNGINDGCIDKYAVKG